MSERYGVDDQGAFTHILIAVDGSESSIHAGHVAIQIASTHQIPLVFVYVLNTSIAEDIAQSTGKSQELVCQDLSVKAQRYLDYLCRIARDHGIEADQVIRRGMPHTEISELARDLEVDLIVIGQVTRSGPRRAMTGSVAERIIEYAPCSVLVVRYSPSLR